MAFASIQYSTNTQFSRGLGCGSYSPRVNPSGSNGTCSTYNGNSGYSDPAVSLSSKAQMMMAVMGMLNSVLTGDFGGLMNMLGGFQGTQGVPGSGCSFQGNQGGGFLPVGNPGFGRTARGEAAKSGQVAAFSNQNIPAVGAGEVREMKPGETVRGANGSVTKWNADGRVSTDYRDPSGQLRRIEMKDGMVSFDGGQPQKLENVGQLMKLPNGDVIGYGNNPGPDGKKLVRVVVADDINKVRTEPAGATNIYDVDMMQRQQTEMIGGGYSMNLNAGTYHTPCGPQNYLNASMTFLSGVPYTHTIYGDQMMALNSIK